jgi:hypothetical protein
VCGTEPGSLPARIYHNKWFVLHACWIHTEFEASTFQEGLAAFVVERALEMRWVSKRELSPPDHQENKTSAKVFADHRGTSEPRALGAGGVAGTQDRAQNRVLVVSEAMRCKSVPRSQFSKT